MAFKCIECQSTNIMIFKQIFEDGQIHAKGFCSGCYRGHHINKGILNKINVSFPILDKELNREFRLARKKIIKQKRRGVWKKVGSFPTEKKKEKLPLLLET